MRKNQIIILVLVLAILILAGIFVWVFLQREEKKPVVAEETIPTGAEENFYSYLELASRSGKFLKFDEAKLEITILCLNPEAMKVKAESFKIDQDTIFSKMPFETFRPSLSESETIEVTAESLEIEEEVIPPEAPIEPPRPNLFPRKNLKEVEEETQTTVFYLPAEGENGIPLARLVKVEALF